MVHYTVEAIIEGVRHNDNAILQFIYRKYFPKIKFHILKNGGKDDEAKDVFQEAIILIYKKIKNNSLDLTCSFKTYLFSVCRYLWLKQLKEKKYLRAANYNGMEYVDVEDDMEELYYENERFKLYQHHFNLMGKDCQKVLELFLKKIPLREIAEIMGYSSEKYAKKRKYQCKELLIKSIQNDSMYKNIKLTNEK